jgi:hypothetical protein
VKILMKEDEVSAFGSWVTSASIVVAKNVADPDLR